MTHIRTCSTFDMRRRSDKMYRYSCTVYYLYYRYMYYQQQNCQTYYQQQQTGTCRTTRPTTSSSSYRYMQTSLLDLLVQLYQQQVVCCILAQTNRIYPFSMCMASFPIVCLLCKNNTRILVKSMGRIQDDVHIIWAVGLHASGLVSFARTQSGCA